MPHRAYIDESQSMRLTLLQVDFCKSSVNRRAIVLIAVQQTRAIKSALTVDENVVRSRFEAERVSRDEPREVGRCQVRNSGRLG